MKKCFTAILITLAILMTTGVVAYAIATLFFKGVTQTSDYNKKIYFGFSGDGFFTESGVVGPGESMSINPVITSDATVDMYVFIRVEMAEYNDAGLYSLDLNSGWSFVEGSSTDDRYIAVYRYDYALTPGASTSALADKLTMVDMSLADYAVIGNINVTMTGYACGTKDESLETAWESIKSNYDM